MPTVTTCIRWQNNGASVEDSKWPPWNRKVVFQNEPSLVCPQQMPHVKTTSEGFKWANKPASIGQLMNTHKHRGEQTVAVAKISEQLSRAGGRGQFRGWRTLFSSLWCLCMCVYIQQIFTGYVCLLIIRVTPLWSFYINVCLCVYVCSCEGQYPIFPVPEIVIIVL